jgi:hypothetical protein
LALVVPRLAARARLAAFAGDIALLPVVHAGETTIARIAALVCRDHSGRAAIAAIHTVARCRDRVVLRLCSSTSELLDTGGSIRVHAESPV